jgi:hypothetical protein
LLFNNRGKILVEIDDLKRAENELTKLIDKLKSDEQYIRNYIIFYSDSPLFKGALPCLLRLDFRRPWFARGTERIWCENRSNKHNEIPIDKIVISYEALSHAVSIR